ncbi:MAG: class I SAM-dependent methyltransferase [Planctomycetota bacterium]
MGRSDERPESQDERWRAKQAHYQDPAVVASYDAERFAGVGNRRSTARKWRALRRGLGREFEHVRSVLDVPCGNGRFTELLLGEGKRVVNADRSRPMLLAAREKAGRAKAGGGRAEHVECDAARLPFADASFDLVLSVRFFLHVPKDLRAGFLREMGRVSRRWVVVDVRHRYCLTTVGKRLRARIAGRQPPSLRSSLAEIDADVAAAGLELVKRTWLSPGFSEKMLLFCARPAAGW